MSTRPTGAKQNEVCRRWFLPGPEVKSFPSVEQREGAKNLHDEEREKVAA
jgi:hypothetical protein